MTDSNLALKIYELENDKKYLDEKVERIETTLDSHVQVTYEIKERLDKLDGFIPYMSETLKTLSEDQKLIKDSLVGRELKEIEKNTEMRTKFKVLWKVLIFIGTSLAGVGVYYFQKRYL